jgi:hypothetical protein
MASFPRMNHLIHIDTGSVDDILDAVTQDGACIARNVLTNEQCGALMTDFTPHLKAMDWGRDELGYRSDFYGARTKRLHGRFSKSPRMTEVLTHPLFLALAERLFIDSGFADDVRLSNTELMVLGKDQTAQDFHTDGVSWRRIQRQAGQEILISANCALTPFTASNGATRVVPGSHRWPPERKPRDHEVCLAEMPAGSALIYAGNVIHAGGANFESDVRVGLYLGYIPSWLRPIENQLVTNTPAHVLALPERARRLLDVTDGGFTVYA